MTDKPDLLVVELLSETCFGRGEGTAGEVDVEVEHDRYGLPFLGGKTLRGLLRDAWITMQERFPELGDAARRVFGPHADTGELAILRVGDAQIESGARQWFHTAVERELHPLAPDQVLRSLTAIRTQTAEDRQSGAPERTTLRTTRVLLRDLHLHAPLCWLAPPTDLDRRCLALAALATRHAGLGRNRGRGFVRVTLQGDPARTRQIAGLVSA